MTTRKLAVGALLAVLLFVPGRAQAYVSFSFGTLGGPVVIQPPCPLGAGYGYGPGYGPPAYYPPYPYYPYPYYAVPVVPYGYPLGYRGAWRTDYPAWSPGPRGYRWH